MAGADGASDVFFFFFGFWFVFILGVLHVSAEADFASFNQKFGFNSDPIQQCRRTS